MAGSMTVQSVEGSCTIGLANGSGGFTDTDVSSRVRSIRTDRGRTVGSIGLPNTGTATVTLGNADGGLTLAPDDTLGAIRPGSTITLGAVWSGLSSTVFTGIVDSINVHRNQANTDEVVTLSCSDAFRELAQHPALVSLSVGQGDTPGQRLDRILDAVTNPPPAAARDIGFGTFANLYDATTFGSTPLAELETATIADAALFWVSRSGVFTYRERGWRPTPASTSPLVLSDQAGALRRITDVTVAWSAEHVLNRVSIQGANGSIGQQDPTSVALLGLRALNISGSLQSGSTQMNATAAAILAVSTRAIQVTPLTLVAGRSSTIDGVIGGLELYDEVRVLRTLSGQAVDEVARIERLMHSWTAGTSWTATLEVRTLPPQ